MTATTVRPARAARSAAPAGAGRLLVRCRAVLHPGHSGAVRRAAQLARAPCSCWRSAWSSAASRPATTCCSAGPGCCRSGTRCTSRPASTAPRSWSTGPTGRCGWLLVVAVAGTAVLPLLLGAVVVADQRDRVRHGDAGLRAGRRDHAWPATRAASPAARRGCRWTAAHLPRGLVGVVNTVNLYWLALAFAALRVRSCTASPPRRPGRVLAAVRDDDRRVGGARPAAVPVPAAGLRGLGRSLAAVGRRRSTCCWSAAPRRTWRRPT